MIALIDDAHFDGHRKVLMGSTRPSLRRLIERRSKAFSPTGTAQPCVTLGSRDHRYDDRRTAVIMRNFESYRDAAFFLEVAEDHVEVGVRLIPTDDVDHSAQLLDHDSTYIRTAINGASWRGLENWPTTSALEHWAFLCDGALHKSPPPQLADGASWGQVADFRIACLLTRAAFLAMTPDQRGAYVENGIELVLAAVVAARPARP